MWPIAFRCLILKSSRSIADGDLIEVHFDRGASYIRLQRHDLQHAIFGEQAYHAVPIERAPRFDHRRAVLRLVSLRSIIRVTILHRLKCADDTRSNAELHSGQLRRGYRHEARVGLEGSHRFS